ncbi:unnamed protein product, partial [Meganyctiphanes norvegica]
NIYLDRTTHWLDEVPLAHRHRFLWTLQDPTRSPSIRVLSECFKSLVKDARHLNGIFSQVQIGPHQMRKLSASYADQVGQEETRVMRIMGFSSVNPQEELCCMGSSSSGALCSSRGYFPSSDRPSDV